MTVSNTFDNLGTLQLLGTETLDFTKDTDSGTVAYVGTEDALNYGYDYYSISFNNASGAWTISSTLTVGNDFTLTDGTVTQNAAIDIGGSYSQTSGALNCSDPVNTSLTIDGSFSITGGTWAATRAQAQAPTLIWYGRSMTCRQWFAI